jgi:hypothetical protein
MIRSFKNWKAKRDAAILAQLDGYSPSHDQTFVWPPQRVSLYDRLVEWEGERPLFVLAVAGVAMILGLVALWVAPQEDGWSVLWQSLRDTFWPW